MRRLLLPILLPLCLALVACGSSEHSAQAPGAALPEASRPEPATLPKGLLLALSTFTTENGKPAPHSKLVTLVRRGGSWEARSYTDPASNVFHDAMVYTPPGQPPGILTFGGTVAAVKLWRKKGNELVPVQTLWQKDFGGRYSRMRNAKVGDVYHDGMPTIVVATHDQGVVATIEPQKGGGYKVRELTHRKNTFIHEIALGDLNGDGIPEIYATASVPNRLNGKPQQGWVWRLVPALHQGKKVVATFGNRHAKEILVADVDGDGRDELYASEEAVAGGNVEIRRYDWGTDPAKGDVIATLHDQMARFLTVGDVVGDGKKVMVIATKDAGLWLARPGPDPHKPWALTLIDANSGGFEHASILTDLDGDGIDELYVASDKDRAVRRYLWNGDSFTRQTIYRYPGSDPEITWNIMPVPQKMVP